MSKETKLFWIFTILLSMLGIYSVVMAQEASPGDDFVATFASYSEAPNQLDVQVYNRTQGEVVFSTIVENVNVNHYHNYEAHNGNLYLLKEVGDTSGDDWAHELWRYNAEGEKLLFSSKGMDFRVAPDESYIALVYPLPPDYIYAALGFLDLAGGEVLQEFGFDYIDESLSMGLDNWSDDSSTMWVKFSRGPAPSMFSKVNAMDWTVTDYDPGELYIGADYSLDSNSGQIIYSDHPTFFDIMSANAFAESGETVSLFIYNLDNGVELKIAESVARPFHPFWVDSMLIGYNDPASDGSSTNTYNIQSGEVKIVEATQSDVFPAVTPGGFEMYMQALVSSSVPPFLPAEFHVEAGLPGIYPHIYVAEDDLYELSLDYGEECQGAGACHFGSMMAHKTRFETPMGTELTPVNTWTAQKVILDKGIQGYFVASNCEANCSDAQIFWVYEGYEYMLGLTGGPLDAVLTLVNATIMNSIP